MQTAVNAQHPSAGQTAPTRNVDAETGVGTARRHEANMLPIRPVTVRTVRPGRPPPMSAPREEKRGVLGKTGAVPVLAKSANNAPSQVGLVVAGNAWGIAGVGDTPPAPTVSPLVKSLLLAGAAYVGLCLFYRR